MATRFTRLLMGLGLLVSLLTFGGVAAAANGGNSDAAHLCQQGGYANYSPDGLQPFANTGACVSYAAHNGGAQSLGPVATLQAVTTGAAGGRCSYTTSGTGLQPGSQITFVDSYGSGTDPGVVGPDGTYSYSGITPNNNVGTLTGTTAQGYTITAPYNISC